MVPVLSMGARDGSSTGSRARRSWGKMAGASCPRARGLEARFIGGKEREGELGRASWGAAAWGRRPGWRGRMARERRRPSHGAGGRGGLPGGRGRVPLARAARGDGQGANRGRSRAVWAGGAARGRPGGAGGVRRRRGHGAGKLEVGETVSGSFVNKSKFQKSVL